MFFLWSALNLYNNLKPKWENKLLGDRVTSETPPKIAFQCYILQYALISVEALNI